MSSVFEILQRQQHERDLAAMEEAQERLERQRERERRERQAAFGARQAERAKKVAAWRAEEAREERERAERKERERQARTQAAAAELKAQMRARYLETPGATAVGFEAVWPELLRRHQIEQTVTATLDPVAQTAAELRELRGSPPPLPADWQGRLPIPVED